mmetsp:Transcript_32321/g.53470  ORF Transcript_32321/g.53470 Transcript_32321/m.53470 type:complete len:202 (+) Transcript_32321:895-1500(+)
MASRATGLMHGTSHHRMRRPLLCSKMHLACLRTLAAIDSPQWRRRSWSITSSELEGVSVLYAAGTNLTGRAAHTVCVESVTQSANDLHVMSATVSAIVSAPPEDAMMLLAGMNGGNESVGASTSESGGTIVKGAMNGGMSGETIGETIGEEKGDGRADGRREGQSESARVLGGQSDLSGNEIKLCIRLEMDLLRLDTDFLI